MARKVFFSFHYQRDIWRVNQVRNSWLTKGQSQTFYDKSLWEQTRLRGDAAIKKLIDDGLVGSSVLCLLLGQETDGRKWVEYEIERAYRSKMGILAVRIHQLKDQDGRTSAAGRNPLDRWHVPGPSGNVYFSQKYRTYDWVDDYGFLNLSDWVEAAAREAGR